MKRIWKLYKRYMIRPILYKSVARCSIAVAAVLLWGRFVSSPLAAMRDGGAVAAAVLFMMGWFAYLRLDGVRVKWSAKEKEKKGRGKGDIIDFVDEHVVTFEELDEDEQLACILAADLLSGGIFLIGAVLAGI